MVYYYQSENNAGEEVMKKVTSLIIALFMALAIFTIPVLPIYADEIANQSMITDEAESDRTKTSTGEKNSNLNGEAQNSNNEQNNDIGQGGELITMSKPLTNLSNAVVSLSEKNYVCNGSERKPAVTVTLNGEILPELDEQGNENYTVIYTNNVAPGTAKVTIAGNTDNGYTGEKVVAFTIQKVPKVTGLKGVPPYSQSKVKITWRKVSGATGYRVKYNGKYYYVKNYFIKVGLRNGTKYNFSVCPYIEINGKTYYGDAVSCTAQTKAPKQNGWYSKNGNKYYYKNGIMQTGSKTINGLSYYFDSNGVYRGATSTMWSKIKNQRSGSKWLLCVDRTKNVTIVYQGSKGKWKPVKYWKCVTGRAKTRTPKGSFKVNLKKPNFSGYIDTRKNYDKYTAWYATRFVGSVYFHSVLYKYMSKSQYVDKRLGGNYSHGCVRLSLTNARWVYNNAKRGTRVVVY